MISKCQVCNKDISVAEDTAYSTRCEECWATRQNLSTTKCNGEGVPLVDKVKMKIFECNTGRRGHWGTRGRRIRK